MFSSRTHKIMNLVKTSSRECLTTPVVATALNSQLAIDPKANTTEIILVLPLTEESNNVPSTSKEPSCSTENQKAIRKLVYSGDSIDSIITNNENIVMLSEIDDNLDVFEYCDNEISIIDCTIPEQYGEYQAEDVLDLIPQLESSETQNVEMLEDSQQENESSSNEISNQAQTCTDNTVGERAKRKKKQMHRDITQKIKKQKGESYTSRKTRKTISAKELQTDPCSHGKCQNHCTANFGEQRQEIFDEFYTLDLEGKKGFLLKCMEHIEKKRTYINIKRKQKSRRTQSFLYTLPKGNEKIQVCQQFLLSTLNISQRFMHYTYENKTSICTPKPDKRGKREPPNKTPIEKTKIIDEFIQSLPAVPSHYCREGTNKLYLPIEFKNKANIYRVYKAFCIEKNLPHVEEPIFQAIFKNDYNIGVHHPKKDKKDKCVTCLVHEDEANIQDPKFRRHLEEKEFSKKSFLRDQLRSKDDDTFICASFDLQKVLNTPYGERNMLLYYSRKYAVYNFTVYESGTKNGYCYLWGESDGHRGSNEISSLLYQYLSTVDERRTTTNIALYCDSCPGQNKNRQLWAMIYYFLKNSEKLSKVELNYLIPGHTYMTVDSMHSTIENSYRNKTVWAPSEWPTLITNSRLDPHPYNVEVITYKSFMNWKDYQQSVLPDTKTKSIEGTKIKIREICRIKFEKNNPAIELYDSFADSSECIHLKFIETKRRSGETGGVKAAYTKRIPISVRKYKDLEQLCVKKIIPTRYHQQFKELPKKNDVRESLNETDDEENWEYGDD